jgi:hypothetical protein
MSEGLFQCGFVAHGPSVCGFEATHSQIEAIVVDNEAAATHSLLAEASRPTVAEISAAAWVDRRPSPTIMQIRMLRPAYAPLRALVWALWHTTSLWTSSTPQTVSVGPHIKCRQFLAP